jgi:peptidoglycan/LPS O-acetylase OafA/YrhL
VQDRTAYYPYFDYLRTIAAIGVFVSHANLSDYLPEQLGNSCVQIFFVLSGFLIGGILLRSKVDDLPRFYFNRATRIWSPYAIAIALLALVTFVKQGLHDPKFFEFFFYMATFVYNWFGPPQLAASVHHMPLDGTANHFWSICVEEQFYLVAPIAILLLPRIGLLLCLGLATALSPNYFASISLGVILAITGPRISVIAVAAIVGTTGVLIGSYILAVSFLSVVVVGLLAQKGNQTIIGKIAGGASYSFYLNHWIGLFAKDVVLKKLGFAWPVAFGFGLAFAMGLSVMHYLWIDQGIAFHRNEWFSTRLGAFLCFAAFALFAIGLIGANFLF